jgi:hypothetical protein
MAAGGTVESPVRAVDGSVSRGRAIGLSEAASATTSCPDAASGSTRTVARQLQHVNDVPPAGIRDVSIWYFL